MLFFERLLMALGPLLDPRGTPEPLQNLRKIDENDAQLKKKSKSKEDRQRALKKNLS